ncbi:MAG: DNA-processing protein DprA [Nitratiruptor sp.]|nr:DNA-processing protein DprA [Nitratiruptor sp.]NPA83946.1 DNA-processing protein DprA [Campylobacterota bacterium]
MVEVAKWRCYYQGNLELLERPKVAIVGARRASQYGKEVAFQIAQGLSQRGVVVVSGGALGIDAMAHRGAGAQNTIAVLPCGIDLRYPKANAKLLEEIASEGLLLSPFAPGFRATPWSFVVRNELVVELGQLLVIAEAQLESGSMRSAAFAQKHQRPIFVPPHRLGQSPGTNGLAMKGGAQVIWELEEFLAQFGGPSSQQSDPLVAYLKEHPFYDEAIQRYGERIVELELEGRIEVMGGRIYYKGD